MENKFKIGDKVTIRLSNGTYEIIADKNTPFIHDREEPTYPDEGYDFVLVKLDVIVGEKTLTPYLHCQESQLVSV